MERKVLVDIGGQCDLGTVANWHCQTVIGTVIYVKNESVAVLLQSGEEILVDVDCVEEASCSPGYSSAG